MADKTRKVRIDKGQIKFTQRDYLALRWIAEQLAINSEHLAILLTRLSDSKHQIKGQVLSKRAVFNIVERWAKAGWVQYRRPFVEGGFYVWLTSRGLTDIDMDFKVVDPGLSTLRHTDAINQVRLYLESDTRSLKIDEWVPERILRRRDLDHYADAEVYAHNTVAAVEVDITRKSNNRIGGIIRRLDKQYPNVWYFVDESSYNAIANAIKGKDKFKITRIEEANPNA